MKKLKKKKIAILMLVHHHLTRPKKREKWVNDLFLERDRVGFFKSLIPKLLSNEQYNLKRFLRVDKVVLGYLVASLRPCLEKHSNFREPISVEEKVIITLRYLATGESFESLQYQFLVAANTISGIVRDTCRAIVNEIGPIHLKTPTTTEEWLSIAKGFETRWNFPNCLAAVDGKHIAIRCPPGKGSLFYNYKQFNSIVLLGACDSEYRFIAADVGVNGAVSDGGVWNASNFKRRIESGELNLPDSPNPSNGLPYVFIGDGAFKLTENFMKPYGKRSLTLEERVFNYRLSRPRGIIENTYGIFSMRFLVLKTKIPLKLSTVKDVVLSCCIIHNILCGSRRIRDEYFYDHIDTVNQNNGRVTLGSWRTEPDRSLLGLETTNVTKSFTAGAAEVRNSFKNYFNSSAGSVSFQYDRINEF